MYQHLPNILTTIRLVIAGVFFVVLSHYRFGRGFVGILIAAIILFLIAALTDWLDGYLARKWKAETTFGRIMDPFCDKVLVLGAFIFLAGPRFVDPHVVADEGIFWSMIPGNTISGIYPWMVALMLARELLVTSIRGELESRGSNFGAMLTGKIKTVLQLITVPVVLGIAAIRDQAVVYGTNSIWADHHDWLIYVRHVLVSATVLFTVASGVPYVRAALIAMRGTPGSKS